MMNRHERRSTLRRKWVLLAVVVILLVGAGPVGAADILHDTVDKVFLEQRLKGLIGKTGLDPFDPVSPLAEARVLDIERGGRGEYDAALIRFIYEDGRSRDVRVWLSHPYRLRPGWTYTGLDRYNTPHEALPGLLLDSPDAPVRLGTPRRLDHADPVFAGVAGFDSSPPGGVDRLIWSPQGDAVIVSRGIPHEIRLDLLPVDGGEPLTLPGGAVTLPRWTADGSGIVYVRYDGGQDPVLTMVDRAGTVVWREVGSNVDGYAPVPDCVLFVRSGALWHISAGAAGDVTAHRLMDLPAGWSSGVIAPDPSGNRLAYTCGSDLCLFDRSTGWSQRVELPYPEPGIVRDPDGTWRPPSRGRAHVLNLKLRIAWSPDGQRVALVQSDQNARPLLLLFDRDGSLVQRIPLGPDGWVVDPQWTPDSKLLFLQTFPAYGRRLVVVDADSGVAYDLSQPGWHASGSLSPTGDRLIVTGWEPALWVVPFERR